MKFYTKNYGYCVNCSAYWNLEIKKIYYNFYLHYCDHHYYLIFLRKLINNSVKEIMSEVYSLFETEKKFN